MSHPEDSHIITRLCRYLLSITVDTMIKPVGPLTETCAFKGQLHGIANTFAHDLEITMK